MCKVKFVCSNCPAKSADCAFGDLRNSQSCIDTINHFDSDQMFNAAEFELDMITAINMFDMPYEKAVITAKKEYKELHSK
jgi:hypothetical protein